MQLFDGAPANLAGRSLEELAVYTLLDSLNISYQRTEHEPADTMEACNRIDAVLGVLICKNLFLCNRQKTKFYLLMMPGNKPFKTKELSHQLGISRLSFANEEAMTELLHVHPGSVSIMGLMNDLQNKVELFIDEDVLKNEYLGCHPCQNTSSLKLKTEDVITRFLPAVKHGYTPVHLTGEK